MLHCSEKPPNQCAFPDKGDLQLITGAGDPHIGEVVDLFLWPIIARRLGIEPDQERVAK